MPHLNSRLCALLAMGLSLVAVPGLNAQDASSAAAPESAAIRGDVNGDGRVTRADADAVRAWLVRGTLPDGRSILPAGDANGDGRVTAADAALISRFAAGVDVSRFPVGRPVGAGGERMAGSLVSTEYECTADFRSAMLACDAASPAADGGARLDVMLYTTAAKIVNTGGGAYSGGDKSNPDTMTYNLALLNLIPQPIGTTDGTTPDTSRLVITSFRLTSPQTTATAQLDNADGTATFVDSLNGGSPITYTNVDYIDYPGLLAQNDTSSPKHLRFVFTPSVTKLAFTYRIWTRVQYPHGYITVSPATVPTLSPGVTRTLTGTVYNAFGAVQGDNITWSSSDPAVATVDASTGLVTAVAPGTATITATSTVNAQRIGTRDIVVSFETTWQGDVDGDANNWHNPLNWSGEAVPTSQSIAIIPAVPNQPVLSADGTVLDLQVASGGTVALSGNTLEVFGDIAVAGTVSGGTVLLSGAAQVQGTIPGMRITGGMSLDGPTKATAAVSVSGGSLTVADQALSISIP